MVARAGERAEATGMFHCGERDGTVRVEEGERIARCSCGGDTFDRRTDEPRR